MTSVMFNYNEEARRVVEALRPNFPNDTIDTSEGYNGRVHVTVVSRRFNGMNELAKQKYIWDMLKDALGQDVQAISLAIVYGTDEL